MALPFGTISDAAKQVGDAFGQALRDPGSSAFLPQAPQVHISASEKQVRGPVPMSCPKCGANIQVPASGNACFCIYCGSQLLVDDGSTTITYRSVDEARIRELEIEAERERIRMETEEKRRPGRIKLSLVLGILGFLMTVIGFFAANGDDDSSYAWIMVALIGMLLLMVVGLIWLIALPNPGNNEGKH